MSKHLDIFVESEYISQYSVNNLEQSQKQFHCSYCDATFGTVISLDEHVNKNCSLIPVYCALKSYGCKTPVSH